MAIDSPEPPPRPRSRPRVLTRRNVLSGAVAIGAAAIAAKALSGGGSDNPRSKGFNLGAPGSDESLEVLRERYHGKHLRNLSAQKDGPRAGGVYRDFGFLPATWDLTGPGASILAAYAFFWNGLISFEMGDFVENPNLWTTEPALAEKWEWAGPTSLIMHLQPTAKWQNLPPLNGRSLTAEDVTYACNAYRKAPFQSSTYRDVDRIEAVDRTTVKFTFKVPVAYFEGIQSQPTNLIFAPEQAESSEGLAKRPIGTGAFILEEGQDRVGFSVRKNPDYWRKDPRTGRQLPYLDRVTFTNFTDPQGMLAAFRDKQLETYWPQSREEWRDVLQSNPDAVSQLTTPPPSFHPHFELRLDKAPWNDVRLRRAMSLAIDRDSLIKGTASGLAGYAYGGDNIALGQEWPWRADQLGEYVKLDVQKAKQLMNAAGFGNGLGRKAKLLLALDLTPFNYDVENIVADSWRRNLGLETEIEAPQDMAVWQAKFFTGSFDEVIGVGFVGPAVEWDAFAYDALNSKSLRNYSHVNDPELDDLTVRQAQELDVGARLKLLRQIMDRDLDQMYRIWTVAPYKINVRHPHVFNITDRVHAWAGIGWGAKSRELAWLNAK